ncbi:MAG: hypothetical protein N2749_01930 [Clostridia bacterium]|nr:hypothetical protein [Clostridia bacterium]
MKKLKSEVSLYNEVKKGNRNYLEDLNDRCSVIVYSALQESILTICIEWQIVLRDFYVYYKDHISYAEKSINIIFEKYLNMSGNYNEFKKSMQSYFRNEFVNILDEYLKKQETRLVS